jgi:hypothetical protein
MIKNVPKMFKLLYSTDDHSEAYLLADRAAGGHGAAVVRAGARVALGHLLPVLPPLAPIIDLRTMKKNKHFSFSNNSVAVHSQNSEALAA